MRQRVTVVLIARNGGEYLERTLSALASQTRSVDALIAVDAGSQDASAQMLAAAAPTAIVTVPPRVAPTFGGAARHVIAGLDAGDPESEWLWLLAHDNAPEPHALASLLAAVEVAPSVAVAGPKLMSFDRPDVIAEFGRSMTRLGASVAMVEGELDQAQHDVTEDVLGVAAHGMLIRRSVWDDLGGFDPGLPTIDAGLDLSVRARLAGHRVIGVPNARVLSAGGPELFDRPTASPSRHARIARAAQLHRRLVYAPALAVPIHWVSLVPLAILRSLLHLLGKHPSFIPGEFAAAFAAAFDGTVFGARRRIARSRKLGWGAIAPLRTSTATMRERRAQQREAEASGGSFAEPKIGYLGGGGLWLAAFAAIVGIVVFGPLLGSNSVVGGGLLPLSATFAELWSTVGYGWREIGTGFVGPADPFAAVLAVLGSLTFWNPSLAVVVLFFAALPLATAGAWFAARAITRTPWIPLVAGILWAASPPLISALMSGRLGAVIAHLALPWLVLLLLKAPKSVASAAGASLLFAVVCASAPSLAPALIIGWVAWMIARPRGVARLIAIPLLAVAMFAPLVLEQIRRAIPLALFADPGAPVGSVGATGWDLALMSATHGLNGWVPVAEALGLPAGSAYFVVAILLAPLGLLALLSLAVPGSGRVIPALALAFLGFATAVASAHLLVTAFGSVAVPVWPGAGLSLFWMGLVGAAIVSLEAIGAADREGRVAAFAAVVAPITAVALCVPLMAGLLAGESPVAASSGRLVPAVVDAEARTMPDVGTLVLTPTGDGALVADLQRGSGATLDDQSTLAATDPAIDAREEALARLAGNLASRGSYDPADDLSTLSVQFVVLADFEPLEAGDTTRAERSAEAVRTRTVDSLDANARVIPVGSTSFGLLWRITDAPVAESIEGPSNVGTLEGRVVLAVQAAILLLTVLLAVPTHRRRRHVRETMSDSRATTFDEETDD
ncbi:glycosyltransferase family 2 protein [Homoserinimonas hongtaonis]|uniref:glycosyltransferase family 2 protein n=1 Tax=Homoserinimonas hongtaonis TaxID=2079791 RepID=UPI000D374019|nr:glycosyltransferase family 2 protein [Salinibacterium hongtaonis]AWB88655.1 glycosyltransferase family 2 protein [Salinibacterium hongtaonis]